VDEATPGFTATSDFAPRSRSFLPHQIPRRYSFTFFRAAEAASAFLEKRILCDQKTSHFAAEEQCEQGMLLDVEQLQETRKGRSRNSCRGCWK